MIPTPTLHRREFILSTVAAVAASVTSHAQPARRIPLIGFIKPFQKLSYTEIADISAEIGWDGIECPLRKGGTIEPPAVEDELPKLVEALRKNQLAIQVIATDVDDARDPLAEKVLRTARNLGIQKYRTKHLYYDLNKPIAPQFDSFRSKLRDLAQANADLQIQGAFQNHSGQNYVGAPVWDIWHLLRDLDSKHLGIYFDIGHATLEGGLSWPLHARVVEPHLAVVSVKDFKWTKPEPRSANGKPSSHDEWCPLGEGMVQSGFFEYLQKTKFSGPVCTHYEYQLGSGEEMIAAMKKDLAVLKGWLRSEVRL
jgi:sugar phosphate isomerase/epimerase